MKFSAISFAALLAFSAVGCDDDDDNDVAADSGVAGEGGQGGAAGEGGQGGAAGEGGQGGAAGEGGQGGAAGEGGQGGAAGEAGQGGAAGEAGQGGAAGEGGTCSGDGTVALGGLCKTDADCASNGDLKGICLYGICLLEMSGECESPSAAYDSRCPENTQCWGLQGVSDKAYCWLDCTVAEDDCAGECDGDDTCVNNTTTAANCEAECSSYCSNGSDGGDGTCSYTEADIPEIIGDISTCSDYSAAASNCYYAYLYSYYFYGEDCSDFYEMCVTAAESANSAAAETYDEVATCAEENCGEIEDDNDYNACIKENCLNEYSACFADVVSCGDESCNAILESIESCPGDCIACGDGICSDGENCMADCAEAPANATCETAATIEAGTIDAHNYNAGSSGEMQIGRYTFSGNDIFYKFSVDTQSKVSFVMSDGAENDADFDTAMVLYKGNCANKEVVTYNDDTASSSVSAIVDEVIEAGDYILMIKGYKASEIDSFQLTATIEAVGGGEGGDEGGEAVGGGEGGDETVEPKAAKK